MSLPVVSSASQGMVANMSYRRIDQMFPGHFGALPKHNYRADFGYPENPGFYDFLAIYKRNGLARALVDKTIEKTWQDYPFVLEKPRDDGVARKETQRERRIRKRFETLRVWQKLAEADRRSMVGAYSAVILRLGDNKAFSEPVRFVPGGVMGLVDIIPVWEGQLEVQAWDNDQQSRTYSEPLMYQYNEAAVGDSKQPRNFSVHPDRILIWSRDGSLHGSSALEAGLNDAITAAKIIGAGGEGFWKNAKSSPVLEVEKDAKPEAMAKMMGVPVTEVAERMGEQVEAWQRGFDEMLMIQGIQAKALGVTLPSPEHFFSIAAQSLAASRSMPVKILVGMQTGERASTEDAEEWAQTNMSRRNSETIPNILALIRRLDDFGMLSPAGSDIDWSLAWTPLTEAKPAEKMSRAVQMVTANKASVEATSERVFTNAEIRAAAGDYEPLSEAEAKVEKPEPEPTDPEAGPAGPADPVEE